MFNNLAFCSDTQNSPDLRKLALGSSLYISDPTRLLMLYTLYVPKRIVFLCFLSTRVELMFRHKRKYYGTLRYD